MAKPEVTSGYSKNGLPYARMGGGPRNLVIFEGLNFNHRPPSGLALRMMSRNFKRLAQEFTVYNVGRRPGLPAGYSMRDMSEDYATMIRDELGGPVNVMGISTGGPIAQHFAADHPELVQRLVLAMTGYRLTEQGAELQRRMGDLARQRKWRAAYSVMVDGIFPGGARKYLFKLFTWLFGAIGAPAEPSDGLVEIEAEDSHNFKDRLAEITVPTLVIGGEEDFFYPVRDTAVGIPNARAILYEGTGHGAVMKRQFSEDVLDFLTEGDVKMAGC